MQFLKTPKFWLKRNFIAIALLPLSVFYVAIVAIINFVQRPKKISKPVICIGNLTVGGSGKTPTALAIGKILQKSNKKFAYLSRGYLGKYTKFLKISSQSNAEESGDEALLLAQLAPTYVARNRYFGAKQIEMMEDVEMIILDDGLQNNSLKKDYNILVIDEKIAFGNGFVMPAGMLRESLKSGISKVDLAVIIGNASKQLVTILESHKSDIKITTASVKPINVAQFYDKKLSAFCGLAFPDKFFSLLDSCGFKVVSKTSFPDHYNYMQSDLQKLQQLALQLESTLIATKKDWVKFPKNFQEKISYLDIELVFDDEDFVRESIMSALCKN